MHTRKVYKCSVSPSRSQGCKYLFLLWAGWQPVETMLICASFSQFETQFSTPTFVIKKIHRELFPPPPPCIRLPFIACSTFPTSIFIVLMIGAFLKPAYQLSHIHAPLNDLENRSTHVFKASTSGRHTYCSHLFLTFQTMDWESKTIITFLSDLMNSHLSAEVAASISILMLEVIIWYSLSEWQWLCHSTWPRNQFLIFAQIAQIHLLQH